MHAGKIVLHAIVLTIALVCAQAASAQGAEVSTTRLASAVTA